MHEDDRREAPPPVDPSIESDVAELYEDAPSGAISTLTDGTIVRMNRTLARWLGYQPHDLIGRRITDLFAPGDRIYYETHYAPLLQMQHEVHGIAVSLRRSDGTRLSAIISSVLRPEEDGRPAVIRTTLSDATDRRKYEQELLRAREEARAAAEREHVLAQALQQSLIPPEIPQVPRLEISAAYHPVGQGLEVGGDFYDVFELPGGVWMILIGDVAGKGADAAGVTGLARHTARGAAVREPRPSEVLRTVNEGLLRDRTDRHCTMCCVRIGFDDPNVVRIAMCVAGHPLPLRVEPDGGVEEVGRSGMILGAFEDVALENDEIAMRPGETLVLRTDGVTDGRRGEESFGEARLIATLQELHALPIPLLAEELVQRVVAFQDGWPRDDVAVVVLRVAR